MAIWIRAICTRCLSPVAAGDLAQATRDADFVRLAEGQHLKADEGIAASKALRFAGPPGELTSAKIFCRPGAPAHFISVERWRGERAVMEAQEIAESILHQDLASLHIRDVLSRTVETVGLSLTTQDADAMGWPISFQTAMWLAARGEGLVLADEDWWDPVSNRRL